jgi:hypothetical protein
MKRLLLAMALLATPVMAQDQVVKVQKLVSLKYADAGAVSQLIQIFSLDAVRVDGRMSVIALTGTKERVAAAEEAIKQLDVPSAAQKNIELTVFFVTGSDADRQAGNPIPQELQSTVAQLKGAFPYKNYLLLDVLSLRTRSGVAADTSGQLTGSRMTVFRVRGASVDKDGSNIRLDGLHAGLRVPEASGTGAITYRDTGISTDVVDVKEGQKLVVGRSSLNGPEQALFLVLIAKVVN